MLIILELFRFLLFDISSFLSSPKRRNPFLLYLLLKQNPFQNEQYSSMLSFKYLICHYVLLAMAYINIQ